MKKRTGVIPRRELMRSRRATAVAALLALGAALAVVAAAYATPNSTASPSTQASSNAALIKCGKTRTLGMSAPLTGDAASLGTQQARWADFFVSRYNQTHKKTKLRLVKGDGQLPNTAQAIKVAEQFASNSSILGVVGPAGSQEVVASTAPLKGAGLAFVTGSATRTSLTDGSRSGYFFRTVPNDDQQGARVAAYISNTLKRQRVFIIDDEETYSQGLADQVEQVLKAKSGYTVTRDHVSQTVSDFSSLIVRIPANTQLVYIPWQLAPKAQIFAQQLRSAGKSALVFGSDGLFAPGTFTFAGAYVSAFPVDLASKSVTAYTKAHGGKSELFGLPSYVATQVLAGAVDKACANGSATRAEVRKFVAQTNIPKKDSLLGFPVRFRSNGEMRAPANFGIFKIGASGKYARVG
jgi:branched-chain amino acid transport system substrate-binding protein